MNKNTILIGLILILVLLSGCTDFKKLQAGRKDYLEAFWHNLVDTSRSFGIVSANGLKRPSYYTYKTMSSKLDYFMSVKTLDAGYYEFRFADKNPVYVNKSPHIVPSSNKG